MARHPLLARHHRGRLLLLLCLGLLLLVAVVTAAAESLRLATGAFAFPSTTFKSSSSSSLRAPKVWRRTRGGETQPQSPMMPTGLETMKARMEELRVRVERSKALKKARALEARRGVPASGRPTPPAPWRLAEHPNSPGLWYYYNEETGETTWSPPVWQKVPHPSEPDQFYYHNPYTGETTWDEPSIFRHGSSVEGMEEQASSHSDTTASSSPAVQFARRGQGDYLRKAALVALVAAVPVGSWWFTGKWWKLPLLLALPLMLYRLWSTHGDGEKMAQASVSYDARFVATSEAQKKELHMFMCSGCGYTLFPARGREASFFTDDFRCPMCSLPKEEFVDMNHGEGLPSLDATEVKEELPAATS